MSVLVDKTPLRRRQSFYLFIRVILVVVDALRRLNMLEGSKYSIKKGILR